MKLFIGLYKAEYFLPYIFIFLLILSVKVHAFDDLGMCDVVNSGLIRIDFIPFLHENQEDIFLSNPLNTLFQKRRVVIDADYEDIIRCKKRCKKKSIASNHLNSFDRNIFLYTPLTINSNRHSSIWFNLSYLTSKDYFFIPFDSNFFKYRVHEKRLYSSIAKKFNDRFYLGISNLLHKHYKYNWSGQGFFKIYENISIKGLDARKRINKDFTIKYKEKEYLVHIDEDVRWRRVEIDNRMTKMIKLKLSYQDKRITDINKNIDTFYLSTSRYQKTINIKPVFVLSDSLKIYFQGSKGEIDITNKLYEKKDDLIGNLRTKADYDSIMGEINRAKYRFTYSKSIFNFKTYGSLNSTSYYNIILASGSKQYKSFGKMKSIYYNGEYQDRICDSVDYCLKLNYRILKTSGFLDSWHQSILPIKINLKKEELSLREIKLYGFGLKIGYKLGSFRINYNFSQYIPKIKKIDEDTNKIIEIKESKKKGKYYGGGFHGLNVAYFF
ncbi:MAG: hypothetical protein QMD92_07420 [bacterium]|nr:hypothetical protein [bacterium]